MASPAPPSPPGFSLPTRTPATAAEHKALAHPLRLRILRLCLDEALTNRQLAERLGRDPATVLHHVRTLVDTDFLVAEPVRRGARGALEKPYRATGRSWTLSVEHFPDDEAFVGELAMVDAFREELAQAGPGSVRGMSRLGLRLGPEALEELQRRLWEVVEDFAARPPDPDGEPLGLMVGIHRRP
jgi:DNA-binding transcriptional ArsR family regulator